MAGKREFWQTILADDLKLTAQGRDTEYDDIIQAMYVWCLLGTPFSWHKTRGGLSMEWIGYWIDYLRFEAGISENDPNGSSNGSVAFWKPSRCWLGMSRRASDGWGAQQVLWSGTAHSWRISTPGRL